MINVLPVNDTEDHEELSTCKCIPLVYLENGEIIIVHSSFDGREYVEQVNEILNH